VRASDDSPIVAQKTGNRSRTFIAGLLSIEPANALKNNPKFIYAWILVKLDLWLFHFLSFDARPVSFKSQRTFREHKQPPVCGARDFVYYPRDSFDYTISHDTPNLN